MEVIIKMECLACGKIMYSVWGVQTWYRCSCGNEWHPKKEAVVIPMENNGYDGGLMGGVGFGADPGD